MKPDAVSMNTVSMNTVSMNTFPINHSMTTRRKPR